jgi:SAM-dependent methyltransferase
MSLLEAGCGLGGVTLPLASLGAEVTAFDIDEQAVRTVQAEARERGFKTLTATCASAYDFDDGASYDVIVLSELLEDLLRPEVAFRNLMRRARPGTFVVITIPNGYGPYELAYRTKAWLSRSRLVRRALGKPTLRQGQGTGRPAHFSRRGLVTLATSHSLQLLRSRNSDALFAAIPALSRMPIVARLDTKMADALPHWLAGGWYFLFEAV